MATREDYDHYDDYEKDMTHAEVHGSDWQGPDRSNMHSAHVPGRGR